MTTFVNSILTQRSYLELLTPFTSSNIIFNGTLFILNLVFTVIMSYLESKGSCSREEERYDDEYIKILVTRVTSGIFCANILLVPISLLIATFFKNFEFQTGGDYWRSLSFVIGHVLINVSMFMLMLVIVAYLIVAVIFILAIPYIIRHDWSHTIESFFSALREAYQ